MQGVPGGTTKQRRAVLKCPEVCLGPQAIAVATEPAAEAAIEQMSVEGQLTLSPKLLCLRDIIMCAPG